MLCPICRTSITSEENPFLPFCSERCKLIDLDNWLEERYRLPAFMDTEEDAAPEDSTTDTKGERE